MLLRPSKPPPQQQTNDDGDNNNNARSERVFILGPSHHVFGRRCWLSPASAYETPFGPLPVDAAVYKELVATGAFDVLSPAEDEAEHSLELHLPFIAAVMG